MKRLVLQIHILTASTGRQASQLVKPVLPLCLLLIFSASVQAATRTASVSGNWNSTATWGGAAVPVANDVVIINANIQVTVDVQTALVTSVTVNGTLIINNLALRLATTGTSTALTVASTGTIRFDGTGTVTGGGSTTAGATVTINSGATLSSKNTVGFMAQTATNTVSTGCFSINRGTKTSPVYNAAANYIFNNSTNQNMGTGVIAANNITVSNTGGLVTATANITASGTVTVNSGANLNLAATTLTLSGAGSPLSVTGAGTFTSASSTVIYSGTSAQVIEDVDYNNLSFTNGGAKSINAGDSVVVNGNLSAGGSATFTLSGDADLTIKGNFTGSQALTMNSGTLTLGGATTNAFANTGTFTAGSGTVNYNLAGAQTMRGVVYNNVILSGSGAKTVTGATINGILSMQGTATAAGTSPTYGTSSALEYKGSAAQVTSSVEFPSAGAGSGGIIINNANGVSLNATKSIGTDPITIGSTVANSILKDSSFQITCTGNLNLVSGTFRLGSSTVATTYPAFASSTLGAGSTIQYASGVAQTVSASPSYKNLVFSGNGAKTTATGTVTIAENWTLTGGTATMNTNNTSAGVIGDILGSATMTLGSGTLSITGDFAHTGTFNAGTSTVNYNNLTGGQTVKSATYNILTMSNTGGIQTAAAAITATTLNTTAGGTLDMGTNTLSVTNLSHNGILLTQNTSATPITANKTWAGTVSYNSASPQTIVYGNYNNLTGTGGNRTFSTAGTIGIAGTFTPGTGTYTVLNSTVNFNGGGNQNFPAFTFHDLVISNAGIKKIPASTIVACQTIDITGNASVEIDASNAGRLNVLE